MVTFGMGCYLKENSVFTQYEGDEVKEIENKGMDFLTCDGCENEYNKCSSSHPSHVKNSIPYSQFLRLRGLCIEDSDFSLKSEEMCDFFHKRGYPVSVVQEGHHPAQQIDRALQTSQKENDNIIPFILTFHPQQRSKIHNSKNFKLLQM